MATIMSLISLLILTGLIVAVVLIVTFLFQISRNTKIQIQQNKTITHMLEELSRSKE